MPGSKTCCNCEFVQSCLLQFTSRAEEKSVAGSSGVNKPLQDIDHLCEIIGTVSDARLAYLRDTDKVSDCPAKQHVGLS